MGKYIKTSFDDSALIRDINKAESISGCKVLLTASKETQDYLEKQFSIPTYPEIRVRIPEGLIAQYHGYKMLRDDTLDFGEVKIYSENK